MKLTGATARVCRASRAMGYDHLPADDRDGQQRQRQDRRETSARVSDAAALLRSRPRIGAVGADRPSARGGAQIETRLAGRHGGVDPAGAEAADALDHRRA
jgi:hypothetical protein